MFFFLLYLDQDSWCDCILSASIATAFSAIWLLPASLQASASFRHFALRVLRTVC